MQGLNKYKDNGIHGYVLMISCGVIFGALTEGLYHERVMLASSIITGLYFAVIHRINRSLKGETLLIKALMSSIAITALELIIGIVANKIFHLHLWDFSDSLFHLLGQICPRESIIRFLTAIPALYLSSYFETIPIKTNTKGD